MRIKITSNTTQEVEELDVSEFTENSYSIKQGKGVFVVEFAPNLFKIEEVKEIEENEEILEEGE